ncbi:MAG: xanthine dehydrogenase family protein subunit M [Rhodobacteraceae bacterium]|nr:MAG: xanthine dehydrogenase family protein subunit M [Paracoccaceae bacterium]
MKAPDFQYQRPRSLDDALALLAEGDGTPLAGGQSLMPMMNFRIAAPEVLVDLNGIEDLAGIQVSDGWIRIGAMTRYRTLEDADEIAEGAPLVARALPFIAHPAIRNRGTVGGSCALADPAAELPALLLALGAEVGLQSRTGTRRVSADDFFLGLYETARSEDELVVAIHLPVQGAGQRIGFHEITRRHGDYAMAGCAIVASGDLSDVRIALFGVSDRALRATAAEAALAGSKGDDAAVQAAVEALGDIEFSEDMHAGAATKQHLAGVALKRAWQEVME